MLLQQHNTLDNIHYNLDNQEHTRETTKTSLHIFIMDHEDEAHSGDEFGEEPEVGRGKGVAWEFMQAFPNVE